MNDRTIDIDIHIMHVYLFLNILIFWKLVSNKETRIEEQMQKDIYRYTIINKLIILNYI